MCAILDANVIHEVFVDSSRSEAGEYFFNWITNGSGHLVVSEELRKELSTSGEFMKWAQVAEAKGTGRLEHTDEDQVRVRKEHLEKTKVCKSNDSHIIALAQASGARLLYSNDKDLRDDFKKKELIDKPRGKIYPTGESDKSSKARKSLLENPNLCGAESC